MLADVENTTERKRHVEVLDSIVEKPGYDSSNKSDTDADLKLDKHGLPLIPQPSRWMDDPLVYENSLYMISNPFDASNFCAQRLTSSTELATMAKVGGPDPGLVHGLPRPLQLCRRQPESRPSG